MLLPRVSPTGKLRVELEDGVAVGVGVRVDVAGLRLSGDAQVGGDAFAVPRDPVGAGDRERPRDVGDEDPTEADRAAARSSANRGRAPGRAGSSPRRPRRRRARGSWWPRCRPRRRRDHRPRSRWDPGDRGRRSGRHPRPSPAIGRGTRGQGRRGTPGGGPIGGQPGTGSPSLGRSSRSTRCRPRSARRCR